MRFKRNRKAWATSSCLATKTRPHIVPFSRGAMAGIVREDQYDMQCVPLYSLLMAAAGNVTVNYLSLDIEGAELQVLETLPWDKVDIEVITVESVKMVDVRQFLRDRGYDHVYTLAGQSDVSDVQTVAWLCV